MCGIAGVWSSRLRSEEALRAVERMVDAQRHRGPDDGGTWTDSSGRMTLGHRRLAVIDTSSAARQPMTDPTGNVALSYNGEIYNFPELREQLERKGHEFRSNSDTEVLLAGYQTWGEGVVDRLVGMFAFAIWDGLEEKLFLARDRAGEKPLYYSDTPNGFAFASELQALSSCAWTGSSIDRGALALYLRYGYVPSPLSIYAGVAKLPPGHTLSVTTQGIALRKYWDPLDYAAAEPIAIDGHAAREELKARLSTAVKAQMVSDMPLGAFLSGGVDSSTVVALMRSHFSGDVRTFTIGFDEDEFDESRYAERVAQAHGAEHTTERLDLTTALKVVSQLPSMYGEPFADPSALPMHLLAASARRHVTVALSGDGADELFGGYEHYERIASYERLVRLSRPTAGTLLPLLARAPGQLGRRAGRLRSSILNGGGPNYRHYFTETELRALLPDVPPASSEADEVWSRAQTLAPAKRAMLTDFSTYMSGDVLTKVDRAAMSVSLETRAPFLDHRLIEWTMRLPHHLVRRKRLLRSLLLEYLPSDIVNRPKQGFDVPIGKWLRTDLAPQFRDLLASDAFKALGLEGTITIDRLVHEHTQGLADHARRLWILFTLAHWQVEREPAAAATA